MTVGEMIEKLKKLDSRLEFQVRLLESRQGTLDLLSPIVETPRGGLPVVVLYAH